MIIDCLGQACPLPVIRTKQAIKANAGQKIEVLVDNLIATENLGKMASQMGLTCKVEKENETLYHVFIEGEYKEQSIECAPMSLDNGYIVVLASDKMGEGEEVLSHKLVESFVYALSEQDELPKYVICYNSGVRLTTQNTKTVEDLKHLEEKGVEVLSCGLCLDFYNLKDELKVGQVSNMYRIIELCRQHRVVRP